MYTIKQTFEMLVSGLDKIINEFKMKMIIN